MKLNLHNKLDDEKLREFISNVELSEPFDYNATYILTLKDNNKVLLAIAYRLEKVEGEVNYGKVLPRFIHIAVDKQLRRTRKGLVALKLSEEFLKQQGHTMVYAYITKRMDMAELAQKFGYAKMGDYYFKSIGGINV